MERRSAFPCSVGLLLLVFVILLAGPSQPKAVQAKSPPSEVTVYVFANFSNPGSYFLTSPGTNLSSPPGFGGVTIFDAALRLTGNKDDPVVGSFGGQLDTLRSTIYLFGNFILNTTSYNGQLAVQFRGPILQSAEGQITGGSGDFRFATGYVDFIFGPISDLTNVVFKAISHLKYFT